ncbi:hypothetical protein CGRA01v4_02422 [Colletotrichum graminicola]|nr:hypothetical protein CGRA01v4_02422 [Colletotrichum graminicola]
MSAPMYPYTHSIRVITAATAGCCNRVLPLICRRWVLLADRNDYGMEVTYSAVGAGITMEHCWVFLWGTTSSPSPHPCRYPRPGPLPC